MQARYLRLDCVQTASESLVSIEIVQRVPVKVIGLLGATQDVGRTLAEQFARQFLWQDFGHLGDWQNPVPTSVISARRNWEIVVLPTVLSNDVYLIARKAPRGEDNCLPPNHFAARLVDKSLHPTAISVKGRVLLVRGRLDSSCSSTIFESYSVEDFQVDFKFAKPDFSDVALKLPSDSGPLCTQSSVTFLPLRTSGSMVDCTYVRLSCRMHTGSQHWSVEIQPIKRAELVSLHSPKTFRDMRHQLARSLLWHDFGHDSDWLDPASSSSISSKYGWEVGLLATTLGDSICMMARKPPKGDERCLPFNHFAKNVLHEKHRQQVRWIMGNVLFVKTSQKTVDMQDISESECSLQPLSVEEFLVAYNALHLRLLDTLTLTILDNSVLEPKSSIDGGQENGDRAGAFVIPTVSASSPGTLGLDGWEVISQAEVADDA